MAFMGQHITDKQTWLEIDGFNGTTFVPMDVLTTEEFNLATETKYDVGQVELNEVLGGYYDGTITGINLKVGYGARMSASGYMDCTEWSVFDTEAEAQSYLDDTYGDDEDEDEDSDNV